MKRRNDGGTYTVRATNRNGSVTSRQHVLSVTSAPAVTLQPSSASVEYGSLVSFDFEFRGEAPFTIQWYHGDEPVAGATSASFQPGSGVTFQDEGTYRARITNVHGEAWTEPATLAVTMGHGFLGGFTVGPNVPGQDDHVVIRSRPAIRRRNFNGAAMA